MPTTAGPADAGLEPESRNLSLRARLFRAAASLSIANQFLLAASVVVFALMGGMGYFTAQQVEKAALQAAGAGGAARMQTAVAPLIKRDAEGNFVWDDAFRKNMKMLIGQGPEGQRIANLKVWLADGTFVFSALSDVVGEKVMFEELALALSGEISMSRTTLEKHHYTEVEKAKAYLEIYAPLITDPSGKVLLAGEIYLESYKLEASIAQSRGIAMFAAFLVSVPMLSLLYFIVRRGSRLIDEQRRSLRTGLKNAIALSRENNRLRIVADHALLEAGKLNEKVLDQIGADLHDGSLQVLTLVKLKLSDLVAEETEETTRKQSLKKGVELVSSVLEELRNFSAGLILPELENVTVHEAIDLAQKRFLEITGCETTLTKGGDEALRLPHLSICLYRFVLEGLLNGYRHARGNEQFVRYTVRRARVYVSVIDVGAPPALHTNKDRNRARLGRVSQKRRIQAFGGRIRNLRRINGSLTIASLPLERP
jgi:signal transduction histidine kinase